VRGQGGGGFGPFHPTENCRPGHHNAHFYEGGPMATLLIVDDEVNQRKLYQEELRDEGYQIRLARNGKEALDSITEAPPDLVVLDIRMPVMDGLEALGKIIGKERNIPVIIHSAYSSYKDDFISWAADDFVVKSSDLTELKRKIRALLERKQV
jgi:CheY-like chemotaxis protein